MSQKLNRDGLKYLFAPIRWSLLMGVAFFLAAGRWDIFRAWLAFGIHVAGAVTGAYLMLRFAPGLANQRAEAREGTKGWDKLILLSYFLVLILGVPIVAGLDLGRLGGVQMEGGSCGVGLVLYLGFFLLFYWAMLVNEHFEGTARIQKERGHKVVTRGPYGVVRHPGYVAMVFVCLADPFIIGSRLALILSFVGIGATVLRTFLEDRMLQEELEGYAEYATTVRYRLIPGVW
ncbi:methyltransferase family protein [Desulfoluna spongiiphila]|uniref:methyltransferase family protein n=1 Tax=Desulfoluna spongiiphila TaxID=419481 RepID=UPI001587AC42|nr:isoprenylcysteine carboxylmethyltransferase family protein [Desulfoluna spongiiphila]